MKNRMKEKQEHSHELFHRQTNFFSVSVVGRNRSYENKSFISTNTVGTLTRQINIWPTLIIRYSIRVGHKSCVHIGTHTRTHRQPHQIYCCETCNVRLCLSALSDMGAFFEYLTVDIIRSVSWWNQKCNQIYAHDMCFSFSYAFAKVMDFILLAAFFCLRRHFRRLKVSRCAQTWAWNSFHFFISSKM